jgi:hypothetical protein
VGLSRELSLRSDPAGRDSLDSLVNQAVHEPGSMPRSIDAGITRYGLGRAALSILFLSSVFANIAFASGGIHVVRNGNVGWTD